MVPCQPKQLVIFSLPFAALVAFFWFKRRRSLSRSDPGGTLDQTQPVDKPVTSIGAENTKVDNSCVKKVEVACSQSPVLEKLSLAHAKTTASLNKSEQVIEPVLASVKETEDKLFKTTLSDNNSVNNTVNKSIEKQHAIVKKEFMNQISVEDKEISVCKSEDSFNFEVESSFKEVENQQTTPDFELKEVFHSTLIEEENLKKTDLTDSLAENKTVDEIVLQPEVGQLESFDEIRVDYGKEESVLDSETKSEVKKEDLDTTLIDIGLEEQTLVEKDSVQGIALNFEIKKFEDKSLDKEPAPEQNSLRVKEAPESDSVEKVENLSTDTGLGSQDLSGSDFQTDMAQGHNTEKQENKAAGLEQKLASLGLDTQQAAAVHRAERDSANHSPAEVMLNSPAISTFSDNHSEGSSDSGKGCSDVATPPSRTPAGGSSVAGDQVPSIYEFVLPQVIVGRLIGRHGAFLHDIRAKTHTNVFIKRHPETNSLKICAIEGTQPDIDAALKMIRQKFPLRRFPDLTLERVSFVKNTSLPINPENLQLNLVEGVNNDVLISYMVSAGHMFLQLPMHMSYHNLYRMACIMNTVYNSEESPPLPDPHPDVVCVAPAGGGWYRALILSVDEEANTSYVRFLDYGGFLTVNNSLLRQIRGDFMLLPFQAIECVLANIVPAGGAEEWSEEANQLVRLATANQILQAQVCDYTEAGQPLIYLYFTQFYQSSTDPSGLESRVVILNQELVSHGHADLIEDVIEENGQTATSESS